jgi:hypothetical protein
MTTAPSTHVLPRLPSIPRILVDTADNNSSDVTRLPSNGKGNSQGSQSGYSSITTTGSTTDAGVVPETATETPKASPMLARRPCNRSGCLALIPLSVKGSGSSAFSTDDTSCSGRSHSPSCSRSSPVRRSSQQQLLLLDSVGVGGGGQCWRCGLTGECSLPGGGGGKSDLSMCSDSALSLCPTVSSFRFGIGGGLSHVHSQGGLRTPTSAAGSADRLDLSDLCGSGQRQPTSSKALRAAAVAMLRKGESEAHCSCANYYDYHGNGEEGGIFFQRAWSEGELYRAATNQDERLGHMIGGLALRRDSLSCCNLHQRPLITPDFPPPSFYDLYDDGTIGRDLEGGGRASGLISTQLSINSPSVNGDAAFYLPSNGNDDDLSNHDNKVRQWLRMTVTMTSTE